MTKIIYMDIVKSFENDIDIMKNNRIEIVFETETESDTKIEIETMKAEIKFCGIFTAMALRTIAMKMFWWVLRDHGDHPLKWKILCLSLG